MCGIAGIIQLNNEPVSKKILQKMTDKMTHRGPDSEGLYVEAQVGFGHRRLAIIDLTPAGKQPMQSADGRYIITYNGEIYNFQELRVELESLGHQFHSRTDSEVVLHAYMQWGLDCLNRFNGMFAFGLWDKLQKRVILARDRYGIKPLYTARHGNTVCFASEIKPILEHPDFSAQLDYEGLIEYFTFQNFFTQNTLFKNVHLLPAGTFQIINLESQRIEDPQTYWDFDFQQPENPRSEKDYLEELNHLFSQAVNRQLISDVPVGSYLSGGMDSGSIVAVASKQIPNLITMTCGFDLSSASGLELGFDERAAAESMSYLFKTEHYEMILKAGDMERTLPKLTYHLEEPRVGQSYPNYCVARLAGKFVKVVLSGAGGDELFGGYPWRYYRAVNNDSFDDYIDKYYKFWQRLIPNSLIKKVFSPILGEVQHIQTRDIFKNVFKTHADRLTSPEDYINHSLYFEAKTFLHGLLVVEDKISMAHSLETRVPFLDNDLVDFAMRVPVGLKLGKLDEVVRLNENDAMDKSRNNFEKTKDGKLILRKAMENYIPESITKRIKQGFSAPDASWFKGDSIQYVKDRLCHKKARIYNYFDKNETQLLINEHLEGKNNRRLLIWSLLTFESWLDQFLS